MSRSAARPERTIRLWQRAHVRGYAAVLCDLIAAQRDVPPGLYAVLRLPPYALTDDDLRRMPPPGPVGMPYAPDRPTSPVALSPRQTEVLRLASHGVGDAEIAARLGCSRNTVVEHWRAIYGRMELRGRRAPRTLAVARGIRSGMIQ